MSPARRKVALAALLVEVAKVLREGRRHYEVAVEVELVPLGEAWRAYEAAGGVVPPVAP